MKVEELFQIYPLAEALRMDSRMAQLAQSAKDEFRFGIEYEFNVDAEGEITPEQGELLIRNDPEAMEQIRDDVRDTIEVNLSQRLKGLDTFILDLFDDDLNGVFEEEDDFEKASEEEDGNRQQNYADSFEHIIKTYKSAKKIADSIDQELSAVLRDANIDLEDIENASKEAIAIEIPEDGMTFEKMISLIDNGSTDTIQSSMTQLWNQDFNERFVDSPQEVRNLITDKIVDARVEGIDAEDFFREIEDNQINVFIQRNGLNRTGDPDFESKRNVIEAEINRKGIEKFIEGIVPDSSVPDGVEVVTKPLDFDDTMDVMEDMFEIIKNKGSTDNKTGMHVNVSHESFLQGDTPDPLKLTALVDIDFFQNQSSSFQNRSDNKIIKFNPRNNVESMLDVIGTDGLEGMARDFIKGGFEGLENQFRKQLTSTRSQGINWDNIVTNFNSSSRRIEFRFFGGEGYETRQSEMNKDILFLMAVIKVISDDDVRPEEYKKGVIRILNRLVKNNEDIKVETFSEFVSELQKGRGSVKVAPVLEVFKGFDDEIFVNIFGIDENNNGRQLFSIRTEIEFDETIGHYVAKDIVSEMSLKRYAFFTLGPMFIDKLIEEEIRIESTGLSEIGIQREIASDFTIKARNARIDPEALIVHKPR